MALDLKLHDTDSMPCSSFSQPSQVIKTQICLLISLTPLLMTGCLGQQSDFVYGVCSMNVFSINDTFSENYNTVVTSLEQKASRALYGLASSKSGSQSDYVYGIYQCRGDVSLSDCHSCVHNAFHKLDIVDCKQPRSAQALFLGCFIRYENYTFYTGVNSKQDGVYNSQPTCSTSKAPANSVYVHNLAIALNDSATAAPKHALFGYNATSVGSGSNTGYTLTQCLGYLSSSECASCLAFVSNFSNACNRSVSGKVFFSSCYYFYSNTSLLFTYKSNSPISGPLSQPPASSPAPASTQYSTIQAKKNNHTTPTVVGTTPTVVGIVVGTSLALAAIVALALLCFRKRDAPASSAQRTRSSPDSLLYAKDTSSPLYNLPYQPRTTKFSIMDLEDATNNFSPSNILGKGGFGSVYQGRLKSGREVAIKMLSSASRQGKTEFENEVSIITTVQHRNLIQLLGCCTDDSKPLLVYEYLPNRSLDLHLFDVSEKDALSWRTRFDIIVGTARGLTYLHKDSHVRIIHRDIKASNILLDSNMTPKIADFGIARLFADDLSHVKTNVAGTLGYLAPEYAMSGQLTEKVDVYGFGIVALEIVSGRRVFDPTLQSDKQSLLYWAWTSYEKGQPAHIMDIRLQSDVFKNCVNVWEVTRVVHLALLCTQAQPQLRPSMSQVHNMLCGRSQILELPTKPLTVGPIPEDGILPSLPTRALTLSISWSSYETASHNRDPITEVKPR